MQGDEFLGFACHDVTQMDSHLFAGTMGKRNGEDKAMFLFVGAGVPVADVVRAVVDIARHGGNGNA